LAGTFLCQARTAPLALLDADRVEDSIPSEHELQVLAVDLEEGVAFQPDPPDRVAGAAFVGAAEQPADLRGGLASELVAADEVVGQHLKPRREHAAVLEGAFRSGPRSRRHLGLPTRIA